MKAWQILDEVADFIERYPECYDFMSCVLAIELQPHKKGDFRFCILGLCNAMLEEAKTSKNLNHVAKRLGFSSGAELYRELIDASGSRGFIYNAEDAVSAVRQLAKEMKKQEMKK